ncbi:MAG: SDR family NAD(P)-dependent oxidoreductase [Promethearchaeota archaeon]|jgi:NAD(P)-dependent dehydrogenase (short-subunit alcohol dehydrogenase family)
MDLKSMTICITGAASGIGHAISLGFLEDGAKVVAVDINSEGLIPLKKKGAITKNVDVTDYSQVKGMVETAADETGRLDVLFNNAGVARVRDIHEFKVDEYEKVIRVNVFGPVYGIRAAIPIMRTQNFGRIINTVSRAAEAGNNSMSPYNSSKAALWSITRTAAVENIDYDILVNGMIPGPTKSGMMPQGQDPRVVYPSAKWMATLPTGGPTGKVFWNRKEYIMFSKENIAYNFVRVNWRTGERTLLNMEER